MISKRILIVVLCVFSLCFTAFASAGNIDHIRNTGFGEDEALSSYTITDSIRINNEGGVKRSQIN